MDQGLSVSGVPSYDPCSATDRGLAVKVQSAAYTLETRAHKSKLAVAAPEGAHEIADRHPGPGHHTSKRRGLPLQVGLLLTVCGSS